MIRKLPVEIPMDKIEPFCRRWDITEMALFGSVLRDDFHEGSDIDFLVTFGPNDKSSLFERVQMQKELEKIVGRKVDLIEKKAVQESDNYIRRNHILESAEVIYES
jgi:predicted nucleotidyltransferase